MILSSIITTIIGPFAKIFGTVLAAFYAFTHSYGLSIILLTIVTMILVFPLTRKGTRSMMQMQLLQPELMALRNKYKKTPGMDAEEKREVARQQQEEMMAFYRENGVSPTGGCLPLFLQFPVFIVLYNVIKGMTHSVTTGTGASATISYQPLYVPHNTALYKSLVASQGHVDFLGFNLAYSLRYHPGVSGFGVAPYVLVILIAVALQYVSIWQVTNRNSGATNINPQMQAIQKFMPLIFVVIYIAFPAGVGLYFIVSSAFRIGQQEWMYKHDPVITGALAKLRERKAAEPPPPPGQKKSFFEKLREASNPASNTASLQPGPAAAGAAKASSKPAGSKPPQGSSGRPNQGKPSGQGQQKAKTSQGKPKPAQGSANRPPQSTSRPPAKQGSKPAPAKEGSKPATQSSSGRSTASRNGRPASQSKPSTSSGQRPSSGGNGAQQKQAPRPSSTSKRPTSDSPSNGASGPPAKKTTSPTSSQQTPSGSDTGSSNADPASTGGRRFWRPR